MDAFLAASVAGGAASAAAQSVDSNGALDSAAPERTPESLPKAAPAAAAPVVQKPKLPTKAPVPIFLENPDGTITEARPHADEAKAAARARAGADPGRRLRVFLGRQLMFMGADGSMPGGVAWATEATLLEEVDFLYSRNEQIFAGLIMVEFLLAVFYSTVYIIHVDLTVVEMLALYGTRLTPGIARAIVWFLFVEQSGYSIVYFALASAAICTKRVHVYRWFVNWSLVGIVNLLLLAYIDKFNLLIFFIHVVSYVYGRFLVNLSSSLTLLPPEEADTADEEA